MTEEKDNKDVPDIIPMVSQPTTEQQKLIRAIYQIAILVNKINCECEVCKKAREMSEALLKLI